MCDLSRLQGRLGALVLVASIALPSAAAWSQPATPDDWAAPRTAWGDPDIGGVWNSSTVHAAPNVRRRWPTRRS